MKIDTLENLFKDELFDIYYAENKIAETLPKMAKAATSPDLQSGFEKHLEETKGQMERIEKVCEILDYKMEKVVCEAIEGLIEEGDELMKNASEGPVRDAAIITAAQKVEHYEIASYGSLCALARTLGYSEAADILSETLKEEKATDEKLTELAYGHVNDDAQRKAA